MQTTRSSLPISEATLARGALPKQERDWLINELNTVGPEYEKRRMAAVIGLLVSGNIEPFARAKDHGDKTLNIRVNPDLTKEDLYLRRLLPRWDEMSQALGGEAAMLERLQITPEITLRSLHAGIPGAKRVFDLLMAKAPSARHVQKDDVIAALMEFAPRGPEMRELLESMLHKGRIGRTIGDFTAISRAGQIFADYFRDDHELRGRVIDAFNADPSNTMATGALAELLLRENNRNLADAVFTQVTQQRHDRCTNHKLMAVFASNEAIVTSITELLAKGMEEESWAIPHWVPALVRRIATDISLQTDIRAALMQTNSTSVKVTFWSLLGRAAVHTDDLRQLATEELRKLDGELEPIIGFDLLTNSHRLMFQVLTEFIL